MKDFLDALSSKEPTPGGGGASALVAAVSCSLCSMVSNLTTGKKKYAQYQDKIDEYLVLLKEKNELLQADIEKDAKAFAPLAKAYSLDKSTEGYEDIMEKALFDAATAPKEILEDIYSLVPVIEDLAVMGSRLAISDVAVAAACLESAMKGCVLNVYINTRSMKNKDTAQKMNAYVKEIVSDGSKRMQKVYADIESMLIS
ncbi:MAG: cyclodeaminase/cyclohydrolase family protein [Lachnospiraceae bacterium]|nr:cyclodeaminase/cyclohydrolase family protein [Lachnospiraceae bacterium]